MFTKYKKYKYILLFALAFIVCVCVTPSIPAIASQPNSPALNTSSDPHGGITSWVLGGGGVAGLGVAVKSKFDELTKKANITNLSSPLEDYTNSPQYLKEKLKILNQEIQKTNSNCDRLMRRFSFTERQLIRRIDGYQSYEDYKSKSTHN